MEMPWGGGPVPATSGKGQRGTQSHEWGTWTGCKQHPGAASITPCSCTRHGASSQQGSPHPPQNAPLAASRPCPRSQRFQEGTRLCPPPPSARGDVGKPPVSPLHPLFSPRIRHHPPRAPSPPSLRSRVRVTAIPILGTGLKIRRARQAAGHGAHGGTRGTRSRRLPARTGPPPLRGSPARGHRAGGVTATYSVDAEAGEEGEGAPQRLEASHPVWPATGAGGLVPGASLARGTAATRTSPAW